MAIINNDFKVKNGLVVGTTATILSTTQSASTNTGALIVPGGAGIGKNLYVGGTVVAQGYDLMSYDGSVHYVSDSIGNDSNDGHRLISPFKTIKHALTQAQSGDKVYIEAGTYYEQFPLTIPQGVSVRGAGLRAVTVYPTTATNTQTAFLLNGECYISDFTVTGFYKPGNAFEFAPGAKITTRSPYVERFSVITRGSNPTANDPYGFDSADAGNGAYLDASTLDPTSLEPAMLWNEATFIVPNATGFYMTNGARAELLNGFVYFADKAIRAEVGTVGYGGVGKTRLKLSGVSGTFAAGDTIIYKSSTGTVLASGIISSTASGYLFLDGPVWGFQTAADASTSTQVVYSAGVSPSTATSIVLADYHQFGAELRCIGSAAVFGNQGVIANGTGTDLKLIAFNLSAIGSGKDLSDDFSLTVQSNEIIQTNGGKIYYQTVDQYGDFRVGDKFLVNQRTGDVSFNSATINLSNLSSLVISDGINSTTLTPGNIVVGSLNFAGNTISSQSGNITIDPSGTLTTINSDATINGNTVINSTAQSNSTNSGALTVGGGVGIGGNLYVGGTMYGSFFGSLSGVATTATNLYLGTAGQIPYQSGPSQTTYTGPGNAGDILVSRGTAGPVFQNTLTLSSSTYSITTTTGNALQVEGGIGTGYIYVTNSGWIAGSEIVTTATIGNSFAGAPVTNPFQITSTANNALVVGGGAIIGGNVVIGGTVQFNGTSTVINSTSVDIGNKLIYLSTLSNSAIEAIGSGFIIGSNPLSSTNTNTWASLTFDGGTPGNWIIGNGLMPTLDNQFNIGDPLKRWSILYANTVTSARINGTEVRDNSNRVITSVTPSGGTGIGISGITTTGPAASFTVENLGVTSAAGSTYIGVSSSTGSIVIENLGVQSLTGSTHIGVSSSTGTITLTNLGVTSLTSGTDISLSATTGSITVNNISTLQSVTTRGGTTDNGITITNSTPAFDNTSGALLVTGGVGIQGRLYAGNIYSNGSQVLTAASGGFVSSITAGTDTAVTTSTGNVVVYNTSTFQSITNRGATTTNAISITNTTASTGTTTGALTIIGGVGVGENLYVGGSINVTQPSFIAGSQIITTATVNQYASQTAIFAGTDTAINTSTGNVTIWNTSTLQTVTGRGATTNNAIGITNTTASTGTTTGALTITGGVGIGENLYVGGSINVTQASFVAGSQIITTATVNQYSNQTAIFAGTDTAVNTSTGNVTVWNTSTLQTVTGRGATTNNAISITNTTASTGTTTGALTIIGGVGIGGDLYVGTVYSNGQQVVTSTSSNTSFVSAIIAGTDTRVSTSTGVVTVWNDSTLQTVTGRGNSTTNAVIITNATNSINTTSGALIVTGGAAFGKDLWVGGVLNVNGSEVITTSTIGASGVTSITAGTDTAISTSTGAVTIWNTGTLQTITSRGATSNVAVSITNTTAANATNSGALQVVGGVGIGGNLYVGGEIVAEKLTIQLTTVTTTQVTTDDIISTYNTTNASSTNSGALQVAGGAGIGSDLWVGGTIYRNGISVGYGYTGSLGYTGSAGFTGSQGTAGYNGSVGYAGSKGDAGYNGSVGYTGSQGAAGYNGSAGFTGSQGAAGYNGSAGFTGSQGTAGYNGSVGFTGSQGTAGYNGSVGFTGSRGAAGYNGSVGFTGSQGAAGYNGSVGYTGSKGDAGYNGSVGYTGSQGTAGYNGSVGYTGSQGTAGYNGSVGYTGSQGTAGYNGSVGYTGSQGTAGYNGSVGFTGSKGDIGYSGSAGPSNIINATAATTGIMYPVMVPATGSNQTAYADTGLYYDTNANALYISGEIIADKLTIQLTTVTTTLVTTDDIIRTTNTTASTSTNTGALQIAGGAGIGGDVYSYSLFPSADNVGVVGNTAATWSNGQFTNLTIDSTLNVRAAIDLADSDVLRFGSSDDAYFVYNGTPNTFELQLETDAVSFIITDNGTTRYTFDKTGVLTLSNSTNVSSTNTGALIVAGGVGIGGGLFVGGITTATILRTPATEIALGSGAGNTGQGSNAIAIGQGAGQTNQPANSIILNASGSTLDGTNAGTYISPIRADATTSASTYIVYYNPTTKEMTTATSGGSTLATSATNVAVTNEIASTAPHYLTFVTTSTGYAGIKTAAVSGIVYQPSRSALALGSVGPVDSDSWAGAIMDVKGPIYARQSNGTSYISLATYLNTSYISAQGATNKMVFQTASSEKMRITTAGYVGIGQSAPATLLSNSATRQANADGISTHLSSINWQVSGQGYAAAIGNTSVVAANTNSGLLVELASSDATDKILDLESGGVNRVRVLGNGNVGIGAIPSYMLDVAGTTRLGSNVAQGSPSATDITANATLLLSGNGGNFLSFGQSATGPQAQWIQSGYTNPTTAVYPISLNPLGGNVGIGILNPISRFVVNGGAVDTTTYTSAQARIADGTIHLMKTSAGGVFEAVRAMNLDTTAGTTVRLLAAATSDAFNNANGGKVFIDAIRTSTNMDLAFLLNSASGAAPVERVRFMGSGNVGIGTNAPAATLHVVGTESRFGGVASGYISVYDASARVGYIQANGGTDLRIAAEGATTPMTFYVNGSERVRIATGGQLLVGSSTNSTTGMASQTPVMYVAGGYTNLNGLRVSGADPTNTLYLAQGTDFNLTNGSAFGLGLGTNGTQRMYINSAGNVGIGTSTPYYKLEVNGSFAATTKSFVIDHPTKPGMKLRYGSLEGPENGVYVRGKLTGSNKIELPDYWTKLVDPDSITVSLTSIGKHQDLYVADISNNVITIGNGNILSKAINCYYVIYGERCDVEKLEVEITHGR